MSPSDDDIRDFEIVAGADATPADSPGLEALIEGGRFAAAWRDKKTIKRDPERAVHVVTLGDLTYLAKAENYGPGRKLRSLFRPGSTPAALHRRMNFLRAAGVRLPASVGVLRLRLNSRREQCLHLMEFLSDADSAHHVLSQASSEFSLSGDSLLKAILDELLVLHRLQRFHGDTKLTNIMVQSGIPYLVDVDGRRCRGFRRRRKDLARLLVGFAEVGVSASILSTMVQYYADNTEQPAAELLPAVKVAALKIAARHQRVYGRSNALTEL